MTLCAVNCAMVGLLFAMISIEYDLAKENPINDGDFYALYATICIVGGAVFGVVISLLLK